jgi:hypothetical protein
MRSWVLSTREAGEWREVLARLPHTDVYFLPEYHRLYEINGDGTARAFVAEQGDSLFFYPLFVRPIERVGAEVLPDPWYDAETVTGYTGPLSTTTDAAFLGRAWEAFAAWCAESRVIAEFVRFNPFAENHRYVDDSYNVVIDRDLVGVKLDCTEEELWENYAPGQRTKVRKGLKSGLVCEEVPLPEGLGEFRRIYDRVMERVGASEYYHYPDAFFDYLCSALAGHVVLLCVRDEDRTVASTLFLFHGGQIHSYLGGGDPDYSKTRPENLLYHTAAVWGLRRGLRRLHFGGGRTAKPDDSLLRFKLSISRLRFPYRLGRRVRNRDAYEELCARWMRQNGATERPGYFFPYRLAADAHLPLVTTPAAGR